MNIAKIAYVQWPEGLLPRGPVWDKICRSVEAVRADILVTNEMPFGPWLAQSAIYSGAAAKRSIAVHEQGIIALGRLSAGAVVSSRPVAFGDRLANEAFVLEGGQYRYVHHKKYFPQEEGFFEEGWFVRGREGFAYAQVGAVRIGVLLCTELFFNEHARRYGHMGVDVILTPRAAGTSLHHWKTAAAMASIVAGAYCVSSNRHGLGSFGQEFGGGGFATSPGGHLIGETSDEETLGVITLDLDISREHKAMYPCYVQELS